MPHRRTDAPAPTRKLKTLTLLTATRDVDLSEAAVLADVINNSR